MAGIISSPKTPEKLIRIGGVAARISDPNFCNVIIISAFNTYHGVFIRITDGIRQQV
ncbi:hypothetical protein SEEC0006_22840 [Salmonella enterica subsp. enterica serovar Choleraesuis str. 0006]|nr:hypothetical protein SEEC0006_22840 [Salmonella enterica subsp. enterica serovar Choleraesuis str. 0006]